MMFDVVPGIVPIAPICSGPGIPSHVVWARDKTGSNKSHLDPVPLCDTGWRWPNENFQDRTTEQSLLSFDLASQTVVSIPSSHLSRSQWQTAPDDHAHRLDLTSRTSVQTH